MLNLTEIFCTVDDFCQKFMPEFERKLLCSSTRKRNKPCRMSASEIMTIVICFHQSNYRDFKSYYTRYVKIHLNEYFPKLVSYNRFVEIQQSIILPLSFFIESYQKTMTGIYFIDSTPIKVCHVKRALSNRVFKGIAEKSKSTMGWYMGLKLHIIINDKGDLMAFNITKSTTDDRKPVAKMSKGLLGSLFGDKGYISKKLFDELYNHGLKIITKIKKNMKNKLMPLVDKILLRKRALVESVFDQLKNISQIEHSRHRSTTNFIVNMLSGLAAYCLQPKKPSLGIEYNKRIS